MFTALLLVALQAGAQSRGPEVVVGVDRDRVTPGDVILYTISVQSDLGDPIRVDLPPLGGFEVESRSERSEVNVAGGRSTTIEFRLRASLPGEWRLGPVQVRQGAAYSRGDAILVTIEGGAPAPVTASLNPRLRALVQRAPPPGALGAAGISVHVSDPVVMVGQQLDVVTIAWFEREVRQQLRRAPTVESPQIEGVWAYPQVVPGGIAASRQVNGKWYDLFVLHQVAFPLTAGAITVNPARLQYSMPLAFQFFSQEERYRLASDPTKVTVRPLPQSGGAPGFSGAIGRGLRVSQRVTPASGRQGEAFTAEVVVSGQGNVALWPQPDVRWPEGLHAYPEASRERITVTGGWLGGSKVFRVLLVADSAGTLGIPPLRYVYLDPETGRFEVATAPGTSLVVAPRGEGAASRAEPPPMRLEGRRTLARRLERLLPGWAWFITALLPPLWLVARRLPRRGGRAAPPARSRGGAEPLAEIERRLNAALGSLVPGQADLSDPALEEVLLGAGVGASTVTRTISLRHRLREARYAPGAHADRGALSAELATLLGEITPRGNRGTRRWRERAGLAGLLIFLATPGATSQTPPEQLYEAGAYRAAAEGFRDRALKEPDVPNHWLNYGNAAWRGGDDAQALAAWVRAARLSPRDQGLRRALLLVPPGDPWAARNLLVSPVTPAELWLLGLVVWLAGWGGTIASRGIRGRWLVLIVAGAISAGAGLALANWYRRPVAVLAGNGVLRLSPHEQAPSSGEVAKLGTVLLAERRGAWMRVEAAGGQAGWLPAGDLRPAGDLAAP